MKLVFTAAVAAMALMLCGCSSPPSTPEPTPEPTPAGTINKAECANGCWIAQYCAGEDFCSKLGSKCDGAGAGGMLDSCGEEEKGTCAAETAHWEGLTDECQECFNKVQCCLVVPEAEMLSCMTPIMECVEVVQACTGPGLLSELMSNFAVKESVAVDVV